MMKTENEMNVNVPLEVVKASEIEPREVKWLWYPYIPFGKVTLLQGDPGDGKSKLTKYNELKEKCRPFLEALEHFPEVAKLFTEKVRQLFSLREAQLQAEKEAREKARQERIKERRNKRGMER